MARLLPALICGALALSFAPVASLHAEERPPLDPLATATPTPTERPAGLRGPGAVGPLPRGLGEGPRFPGPGKGGGPDAEKARQAFQQMSPEERHRWMQRFKEFSELPPERKKEIFERGEYFRRKMREDVEAALRNSGLTLSDEQKKKFAERYVEERRVIEEDLRKQVEELRRPKLQALAEKLKQEFAAPAPPKP